jgi:hypothetical protein
MKTASNILFTQSIVCRSLLSLVKHARVKNKIVPNLDTAIALLISPMPKFTVQGQYFFCRKKAQFLLGLKAERKSLHCRAGKLRPKSGSGWAANYF